MRRAFRAGLLPRCRRSYFFPAPQRDRRNAAVGVVPLLHGEQVAPLGAGHPAQGVQLGGGHAPLRRGGRHRLWAAEYELVNAFPFTVQRSVCSSRLSGSPGCASTAVRLYDKPAGRLHAAGLRQRRLHPEPRIRALVAAHHRPVRVRDGEASAGAAHAARHPSRLVGADAHLVARGGGLHASGCAPAPW